jgi:hypothetical protein
MPTGAYPISSHIPHLVARSEAPAGQGPAANPGPQGGRLNGSCPVAGDPEDPLTAPLQIFSPQPSLARGGVHTQLTQPPLSHSSPRIAALLVGPPPLTRFSLCSLSLSSLVLSLSSLSLSRLLRESAIPSSRYLLSARRRIDTRCLLSCLSLATLVSPSPNTRPIRPSPASNPRRWRRSR